MALISPIGRSDFREIRESGSYYVDKSALISQIVASGEKVLLLPRPRRFGKTLNMTMLQAFFDRHAASGPLFAGLSIMDDPVAMAQFNHFPTLFITFKDITANSWDEAVRDLKNLISQTVYRALPLVDLAQCNPMERKSLEDACQKKAEIGDLKPVLALLIELLQRCSGIKVILLIDEYDSPLHQGYAHGFFTEMASFMRGFLSAALKDNVFLERAIITGIMRVGKESIYSGLNHMAVYSILDEKFANSFGFTETEVKQLLLDWGLSQRLEEVQAWYNGYRFAQETLYNPWSILCMATLGNQTLKAHWINTSSNEIVKDMITRNGALTLTQLETLLRAGTVTQRIHESIALNDLDASSVWSLLLFTGYLTATSWNAATGNAELCIPNLEVRCFFQETVTLWLGTACQPDELLEHLVSGRFEAFSRHLERMITSILSFHDTRHDRGEWVYHVFVLGLLANLRGYQVHSNRESGHGRYDLALIPDDRQKSGFIFEFKASDGDLDQAARTALKQIEDQDYGESLRARGIAQTVKIGVGFSGKRLVLAVRQNHKTAEHCAIEVFSPKAQEKLNSSTSTTSQQEGKQKLILNIQNMQARRAQAVLSTEALMPLEMPVLESMAEALQSNTPS